MFTDPATLVAQGDGWKPCERCGRRYKGAPHTHARTGTVVWAYPPLNPCAHCGVPASDVDAQASIARQLRRARMRKAGVPEPLLDFSIASVDIAIQGVRETDDAWQARCRQLHKTGVHKSNAPLLQVLEKWKPPGWLVFHGPPGVGKTAWMAGLVGRLLDEAPLEEHVDEEGVERIRDVWDITSPKRMPLPGQVSYRRPRMPAVRYARLDILVERYHQKWEHDRHPLEEYVDVPILFLDELGLDAEPSKREQHVTDRLLGTRADEGRCTVLATNRTFAELVDARKPLYGLRVASRLAGATVVGLGGPSWRT